MSFDKGDFPVNSHVVFYPNKQSYFESFRCLDLVVELKTGHKGHSL